MGGLTFGADEVDRIGLLVGLGTVGANEGETAFFVGLVMGGDVLGLSVGANEGATGFVVGFGMGDDELALAVRDNEGDTGLFVGFGIRDGMGLLSIGVPYGVR